MENSISYWQHMLLQEIDEAELSVKQKEIAKSTKKENYMGTQYRSSEEMALAMLKKGITEQDHEVSMAQNSLDAIIEAAMELKSKMGSEEKNIPAWIQDHVAKAEDLITQASQNYHEYEEDNQDYYEDDI